MSGPEQTADINALSASTVYRFSVTVIKKSTITAISEIEIHIKYIKREKSEDFIH